MRHGCLRALDPSDPRAYRYPARDGRKSPPAIEGNSVVGTILYFTQTIFNMPLIESDIAMPEASSSSLPDRLPFPPTTYSHILHCSYHDWHPAVSFYPYMTQHRTYLTEALGTAKLAPKSRGHPFDRSFRRIPTFRRHCASTGGSRPNRR